MAAPTSEEFQLIEIFRRRVSNVESDLRDRGQFEARHILRWIRARESDLTKAEDMLRKHLVWRKLHGIGPSLLQWTPPSMITATYPMKLMGFDKEGSPILFIQLGQMDVRLAVDQGHKDALIRYKDKIFEQIMQLMQCYEKSVPGSSVTQFICIQDWQGFSLKYIMRKEVVEVILETARCFEANYPETLKSGFNINCPKVFAVLFNMIKPFLSERTLSKISIFDSNASKWEPSLKKMVDHNMLPQKYGGSRETSDKFPPKLWDLHNLRLDTDDDEIESIIQASRSIVTTSTNDGFSPPEDLTNIRVAPGYKVHIPVKVTQVGDRIRWFFRVQEKDISFSLVLFQSPEWMLDSRKELLTPERIEGAISGSHICEVSGDYALCFDNSYSTFKAKFVEYNVSIDNPFSIDNQ